MLVVIHSTDGSDTQKLGFGCLKSKWIECKLDKDFLYFPLIIFAIFDNFSNIKYFNPFSSCVQFLGMISGTIPEFQLTDPSLIHS